MNKKFCLMFLTSAFCLLFLSSCYHLVGSGSSEASKEIENLAITILKNKTDIPEIEITITDAMVKEFTAFSPKIITDVEHAKAILEGKVLSYTLDTVAADERDKVLEYRLNIKLEILKKAATNRGSGASVGRNFVGKKFINVSEIT